MISQYITYEVEYEDHNEGLLNGFSNGKVATYSDEFKDDSWSFHIGYLEQENEKDIDMSDICLIGEVNNKSSCSSDFYFIC